MNNPIDLQRDLYSILTHEEIMVLASIAGERKSGEYRIFSPKDLKNRKALSTIDVDAVLESLKSKQIVMNDAKDRWKVINNDLEHKARMLMIWQKVNSPPRS